MNVKDLQAQKNEQCPLCFKIFSSESAGSWNPAYSCQGNEENISHNCCIKVYHNYSRGLVFARFYINKNREDGPYVEIGFDCMAITINVDKEYSDPKMFINGRNDLEAFHNFKIKDYTLGDVERFSNLINFI